MSEHFVGIKKKDAAQRIVFAEVYAPSRPDSDAEFMRPQEIQKMAYQFMKDMNLSAIDQQHNNQEVDGACVVESFIARKGDPDFIEGAWVVGMHINNDAVWAKVEKGEINGFSMEALVTKHPQDVDIEIPSELQGKTYKADDGHEHVFHVSYDEHGQFLGGHTDIVNKHSHEIRRGTSTELSAGHSHRFSHVEGIVVQG